jgi:isoleucyl-tRNA synthetase
VRAFWRERDVFARSLALRSQGPRFVFYEGPPTANGLPHNGHALTRVMKDVIPRYKAMRGYSVPRKAGWDTHGLPVEIEVEKELRISGKDAIEAYGVEPFVRRCLDSVFRYTEEWQSFTEKLGFWLDMGDAYVTYHQSYVESVWWALSQLFARGLLYRGHKVVWWWAQGGTVLIGGRGGRGLPHGRRPVDLRALPPRRRAGHVAPGLDDDALDAASNSFAAVNPDFDYVVVRDGEQRLIVAAALRDALAQKVGRELPVERSVRGVDLVGRPYVPPFDWFRARYPGAELWRVKAADFVELDAGTGIVHIAPHSARPTSSSCAASSSAIRRCRCSARCGPTAASIPEIAEPAYAGRWVKDADRDLTRALRERGLLWHAEQIRPRLSVLRPLRLRPADPVRAARVVHPHHRARAGRARQQRAHPLAARAHPRGPLRRLPAQQRRLGALARALLGHAAQHLGERRDRAHGGARVGRGDPRAQPEAFAAFERARERDPSDLAAPRRAQAVDRRRHLDARGRARAPTGACPR